MKKRWWWIVRWLAVGIALWSGAQVYQHMVIITSSEASHGQGLSEIGKGIQMFAITLPRLIAAWMIWVMAKEKLN